MKIKAIFEDTRQKEGKHDNIKQYCAENCIDMIRQQLYVGDYTLITDQRVCIDTKKDLLELVMDLGSDKGRFMCEVARAKKYGIKLIVLIEQSGISGIPDVAKWYNPLLNPKHSKHKANAMTGKMLAQRIYDVHINYGTQFLFCDPKDTGKRIMELLSEQN